MKRILLLVALLAPLSGLSQVAAGELQSLRGAATVDQADPAPQPHPIREDQRWPRDYPEQPPLIPHRIDKYQVDLKTNRCLTCHDWPNAAAHKAPMIGVSHYVDRAGVKSDKLADQRWFCNQCHVPQADAPALVDNLFAGGGR